MRTLLPAYRNTLASSDYGWLKHGTFVPRPNYFAVLLWNSSDTKRLRQLATVSFPSLEYVEDIYHKIHAFYEIPYDTGAGRQLKFEINEFCRHFICTS